MIRAMILAALVAVPCFAQPRGGGPGGPGGAMGGPGGGMMWGGGGGGAALNMMIYTLQEMNFTADFTLTKEQKEKIASIREDFRKEQEKWRTDHQDDFKKVQDQTNELRGADPQNREKWQEIGKLQQQLWASAPSGDEQAKQIKALLTPEQLKAYEDKVAQRQAEAEKMRKQWEDRARQNPNPNPRPQDDGGKPQGL